MAENNELTELKKNFRHLSSLQESIKTLLKEHDELADFVKKRSKMFEEIHGYARQIQLQKEELEDLERKKKELLHDCELKTGESQRLDGELNMKLERVRELELNFGDEKEKNSEKIQSLQNVVRNWEIRTEEAKKKFDRESQIYLASLKDLSAEKMLVSNEVSRLKILQEEASSQLEETRKTINEAMLSAEEVVKDVQTFRNQLKPYIYEVNKYYVSRGQNVPPLIKDWKPKLLQINLRTFKRLKQNV